MSDKSLSAGTAEKNVANREGTRNPEFFVSPLVDIYEKEDALIVVADLPGVTKDGLGIRVEQGILTIEGKAEQSSIPGKVAQEFEPINFFRQFEVAEIVDQEKISAELKHGVLTLTLPKKEATKPRSIPITVS